MRFFDGFSLEFVDVGSARLRVRIGGASGPCVLLLHGHPRTHTTWYRVAPLLVDAGFTVVCPDLPGYGASRRVVGDYSKKAMAGDLAALMKRFGSYAVVGHDRGSYVAHRMAVEGHASRLAVLDCVPITAHLERCDHRFAAAWWHWFFFAQTSKPAETIINRDPDAWYRASPDAMGPENYADWWKAIHTPEVVFAMVGDYRAGLHVDRHDEAADRAAGRLVTCPTLVGWSLRDDLEELHGDPVAIWREWASGPLQGATIDSGHHMAEEAPEELARVLAAFLAQE